MAKIIIGLVGPLASGKGEVKKYLENKFGAISYKFSDILRDVLKRLYLPTSRENLQTLSTDLRTKYGNDILAKVIAADAKNDNRDLIIIDGVRRLDDILYLKDDPNFKLIAIDAKPEIRFKRMCLRNENPGDAHKTFAEFLVDSEREAEKEIPKTMATANYHLENNDDLSNLFEQIDILLKKITN